MDEGWTRFTFDTFNVPYSSLTDNGVRNEDLAAKFDVIILPSQRARETLRAMRRIVIQQNLRVASRRPG